MKIPVRFLTVAISALFAWANSAGAAIIATFDLRVAGSPGSSGHDFVLTQPSQVVHLEAYVHIANNDGDHSNDSIAFASIAFMSWESGTNMGNYSNGARNSALFSMGSNGAAANLDANPDLEWGGTSGTSTTGNMNPGSLGLVVQTGDELLLGTIDWIGPANLSVGSVLLYVQYFRNAVTSRGAATIMSDGVPYPLVTMDQDANTLLAVGHGVTNLLTPPPPPPPAPAEPAALGFLTLGGLVLLNRPRRKSM